MTAMMSVSMKVTGSTSLARHLRQGRNAFSDQAIAGGLLVGAQRIVNRAQQLAPVKTGNLRRSIHAELGEDGRSAIVGTNVEYAPHQEYGTSRMPAHPFLRPAFDEEKSHAISDANKVYKALLQRAVA